VTGATIAGDRAGAQRGLWPGPAGSGQAGRARKRQRPPRARRSVIRPRPRAAPPALSPAGRAARA